MRLLKKIIIITGIIVILLLSANWGVNKWVNIKLPEILSEKNKTPYNISYDSLQIAVWDGNIKVSGIRLSPKSALNDTLSKAGLYSKIETVEIRKFKIWDVIFNDKIRAKSITINKPSVVLYQKTEKAINSPKSIRTQIVEPFQTIVVVSNLYLNHGDMKIIYVKNNKPLMNAANINVKLEGIVITDDIMKRTIPVSYEKYAFSCDSIYYKNNSVYHIKANKIQTENDGFSMKDFEMIPDISRGQFVSQLPLEKDLYTLKAASILIKKMDWGFKDEHLFFNAGSVNVDKLKANIYRSKMPKDDLTKKKLYNRLLRDIKFPLKIDSLLISNSDIVYEEEIDFKKGPGKISFNNFNLAATNIQSAFGNKKMTDMKIKISCLFMNISRMKVDWKLNVLDKTDGFNIKGSILNFNTKNLVSFTKPYSNMKQEGIFDEVYFNITGNDIASEGEFALKYHDMKVSLYKKKDPKKKNKLKSAIANLLLKNDSDNKVKNEKVGVKRIPEKSFYNFFWRNIEEGLKKVLI